MPRFNLKFARAVASLVGTTVGAGMFALPYVFARLGFLLASFSLLSVSFLSTLLNQLYARVIIKTEDDHQLSGYAGIYLGRWGKGLAFFSLTFGLYGALIAYLLQGGKFLSTMLPIDPIVSSGLFWLFLSSLLVLGLRITSISELFFSGSILILVLLVSLLSFSRLDLANLNPILRLRSLRLRSGLAGRAGFPPLGLLDFLSHLGVVLFALGGTSAIPEVEEILRGEQEKLPKVIKLSGYLVLVLYAVFSLAVVGACGGATTPAALDGLGKVLGQPVFLLGSALGVFALGSSYLLLGYSLREVYFRDLGIPKPLAWFLVLIPPILIVFFSNLGFISILSLTGMIGIGTSWFLVLLIYLRSA